jgi:hypothetical protein
MHIEALTTFGGTPWDRMQPDWYYLACPVPSARVGKERWSAAADLFDY